MVKSSRICSYSQRYVTVPCSTREHRYIYSLGETTLCIGTTLVFLARAKNTRPEPACTGDVTSFNDIREYSNRSRGAAIQTSPIEK